MALDHEGERLRSGLPQIDPGDPAHFLLECHRYLGKDPKIAGLEVEAHSPGKKGMADFVNYDKSIGVATSHGYAEIVAIDLR